MINNRLEMSNVSDRSIESIVMKIVARRSFGELFEGLILWFRKIKYLNCINWVGGMFVEGKELKLCLREINKISFERVETFLIYFQFFQFLVGWVSLCRLIQIMLLCMIFWSFESFEIPYKTKLFEFNSKDWSTREKLKKIKKKSKNSQSS